MNRRLAVDIDERTSQNLQVIGEATNLSEGQMVEEAVRAYSREKSRFLEAVRQGQADIEQGRTITHQDLLNELESRLADLG